LSLPLREYLVKFLFKQGRLDDCEIELQAVRRMDAFRASALAQQLSLPNESEESFEEP
jgi:hypothetical protein